MIITAKQAALLQKSQPLIVDNEYVEGSEVNKKAPPKPVWKSFLFLQENIV